MNNQQTFTMVYSLGCERVGKGIAMQSFGRNQACIIQQRVKENNV
ncbi:hypothetical protein HMPREF1505_1404 [Prevotella sp. ICM33]|nr:hypothetical protein HMPREF1505_1404 [Prevotella sp. ICM33]